MKRDFDLIRRILADIENVPAGKSLDKISYPEYDQPTIYEHVNILEEAGLIKAKILKAGTGIGAVHISGLTWAGHDFLNSAKDDSIWQKAKDTVLKPTASITFGLLLEWLKTEAKQKLGLP
jgi:DNA-binding transcriptional ArsR family regulator